MWGKESSRGPQPFKLAGSHQHINSCLTQGRHPINVSLQDGENPEKNTRKEGGSCPGTPRGSRPEWLGGLGLGGTSPAPPGAPRELPC